MEANLVFEKQIMPEGPVNERAGRHKFTSQLLNAQRLLKAGEVSMALHLIRAELNQNPWNAFALRMMLDCTPKERIEERQKLLNALCQVSATSFDFFEKGELLSSQGRNEEALQAFFDAELHLNSEVNNDLRFNIFKGIGNIFVKKGDYEGAEEAYHKAYTLVPESDILLVNLGTLAVTRDDWSRALEKFRRAIEVNQNNDKAWVGMALCHRKLGDEEMSYGAIHKALEIAPENRTAALLVSHWCYEDKNIPRAIPCLQSYLAEVNDDLEISFLLIQFLSQVHSYGFALLEAERCACFHPENLKLVAILDELKELAK